MEIIHVCKGCKHPKNLGGDQLGIAAQLRASGISD